MRTRRSVSSPTTASSSISRTKRPAQRLSAFGNLWGSHERPLKVAPKVAERIPHARDIIGFRNILAHGYAEVDHSKVYDIAVRHAPQLLTAVREALKEFPEPKP